MLEKFIERLPDPERNRPILIIDDKLLSWKMVLKELKEKGKLSKKIEQKFKKDST